VNQGSKREIDKPPTNPKKDKIHTYYIMPLGKREKFKILFGIIV